MASDDFDLFDMLNDVVEPTPKTPEEEFCARMLTGDFTKLDQMSIWLGAHISIYHFMTQDHNIRYVKKVVTEKGTIDKEIDKVVLARHFMRYYLNMYHLPHFQKLSGITNIRVCDADIVITTLLQHEKIKKVVHKDY